MWVVALVAFGIVWVLWATGPLWVWYRAVRLGTTWLLEVGLMQGESRSRGEEWPIVACVF
jgi:hypothetical protein